MLGINKGDIIIGQAETKGQKNKLKENTTIIRIRNTRKNIRRSSAYIKGIRREYYEKIPCKEACQVK